MRRRLISRRGALAGGLALAVARPVFAQPAAMSAVTTADGRSTPISTWSAVGRERGVILFSHGALSSPDKYGRIIGPWTEAGFKVLAPLHIDSTDYPDPGRYRGLNGTLARVLDMRALSATVSAPRYIAAGHSWGGLIALTLGGARPTPPAGVVLPPRDPRVAAVAAFSPPGPAPGLIAPDGYAGLAVPALIETGDKDVPATAKDGNWRVHLAAYDAAPPGDKYALVLRGVDHYFGGLICNFDRPGPPQLDALNKAVAVSTDFLKAYGLGDQAARLRLDATPGPDAGFQLSRK